MNLCFHLFCHHAARGVEQDACHEHLGVCRCSQGAEGVGRHSADSPKVPS